MQLPIVPGCLFALAILALSESYRFEDTGAAWVGAVAMVAASFGAWVAVVVFWDEAWLIRRRARSGNIQHS